jgi:hypothetical protein
MNRREAQRVLELSTGFLLDQTRFARGLTDFVDILLILAVTQANVEALMRDPGLQRAYADFDNPPPDDLRRPISINALAYSLRLPFETVRRRVTKLSLFGVFRTTPDGIYVPGGFVRGERHLRVLEAGYGRLLALYGEVGALAAFRDLDDPGPAPGAAPPLRAAARVASEYVLRLVDITTAMLGDPVDAAIWLEVMRSSAGPAPAAGRLGVRGAEVARRLGLPTETVRRRLVRLVEVDACQKHADGVTITDERLQAADVTGLAEKNLGYLRRMFAGLAQLRAAEISTAEAGG